MKAYYILIPILLFLSRAPEVAAQEVVNPNYGLKNPRTLEIIRIQLKDDQTLVDFSLTNEIEGGYFCISKNTFIEYGNGKKKKLNNLTGLPYCPETYKFSAAGEKVYFTMKFDKIQGSPEWFDIIEYAGENSLSVLALTTDRNINERVNAAFSAMDRMEPEKAIKIFSSLLPELQAKQHGLTGSVYINLAELYSANNMNDELDRLLLDFESAAMPHKKECRTVLENMKF